ncbi:unnamed protein product [[Candida] boidinii]|nr:unnamed protein product [[Candida] boidinii]
MSDKLYIGYNSVHKLCQKAAVEIRENPGKPDIIIAIGGGGFIPARIIRSFLKQQGETNIPIQAIGLSLYENMGTSDVDTIGKEVVRTQWLDFGALIMLYLNYIKILIKFQKKKIFQLKVQKFQSLFYITKINLKKLN